MSVPRQTSNDAPWSAALELFARVVASADGRPGEYRSEAQLLGELADALAASPLVRACHIERTASAGIPEIVRERRAADTAGAGSAPAPVRLPIRRAGRRWGSVTLHPAGRAARDVFAGAFPQRLAGVIGNALDRHDHEHALVKARLLQAALSEISTLVCTSRCDRDQPAFLSEVCEALARDDLVHGAWVGRPDACQRLEIVAASGARIDELRRRRIQLEDPRRPLAARAWASGELQCVADVRTDSRVAPWRDLMLAQGLEASVNLVIRRAGARWGVLGLSFRQPTTLDADARALLRKIAAAVGHALDEQDHRRALSEASRRDAWLATHDPLTGLGNRAALEALLPKAIARARREGTPLIVALLDIDEFKPVNDTYGHAVGDQVLKITARRLQANIRASDAVTRLGGDEFVLVLENMQPGPALDEFFSRCLREVAEPVLLSRGVTQVSVSAGVTCYPQDDVDPATLLRHADKALYRHKAVKGDSRRAYALYDPGRSGGSPHGTPPAPRPRAPGRVDLDQVLLHYQPVLSLSRMAITRVEALARLRQDGRVLPPGEFLHRLNGRQLRALGRRVIDLALTQTSSWRADGLRLSVDINVGPQELLDPAYAEGLLNRLSAFPSLAPGEVTLEVLETPELVEETLVRRHLEQLREAGVRVALDDVGAAYSSLLRLRSLPVDEIKIDQAFIADLDTRPRNLDFLEAFIHIGRSMGVDVTVEGVETDAHVAALAGADVDYFQGFGISRPLPPGEVAAFVRTYRPDRGSTDSPVAAFQHHLHWLEWAIKGIEEVPAEMSAAGLADGARCSFHRWLAARTTSELPSLNRIRQRHVLVHRTAAAASRAAAGGRRAATDRLLRILRHHSRSLMLALEHDLQAVRRGDPGPSPCCEARR